MTAALNRITFITPECGPDFWAERCDRGNVVSTLSNMSRLQVGVIRFRSVASAIGQALGIDPAPDCRIGQGRITLTFRRMGASRWSEEEQIGFALQAASIARTVLADDHRRAIQRRAGRAIVVVLEDTTLVRGCEVVARWESVVPAAAT
jgi:hypothetical protein